MNPELRQDGRVPESDDVPTSELLEELKWRGLVAQTTDEAQLAADLAKAPMGR